jgi:phosphatidylinositol glycan class V
MCAPYAEAMFSFLNFTGMFLYAHSRRLAQGRGPSALEDICKLGSGLLFAFAALVRSNGLLSGSIFLYDVARYVTRVTSAQLSIFDVRRIIVSCLAGVFVALGFVGPQYVAYKEFCNQESDIEIRPWCEKSLPSIYSWVQSHYW